MCTIQKGPCCPSSIPHISWLLRRLQQRRVRTLLLERRKIVLSGQDKGPRMLALPACLLHGSIFS